MRCLFSVSSIAIVVMVAAVASSHERQEIDGMRVVFGGEPEPVLNGEFRYLRWRFADLKSEEPVADLEDLRATIRFDGKEFGPFDARGSRRDPGMYQTHHIFTKSGEGEVTLTFKRAGQDKTLEITFPFRVADRKTVEIP